MSPTGRASSKCSRGHRRNTVASVWSCLAAHAAVLALDGIERERLAVKRCGVYQHSTLVGHALLEGVAAPLAMPHSRWNELSVAALRQAGYTLLSWSAEAGADAFVRQDRRLMLFFQGHPEYEDTTLLKEYRRDVGRFLNAQQPHYPTLPVGYLSAAATAVLGQLPRARPRRARSEAAGQFPVCTGRRGPGEPVAAARRRHLPQLAGVHRRGTRRDTLAGNGIIGAMSEALRDRLLRQVAQILGKPDAAATLPVDGRLSELGMSSIKMVNLMLAVEAEFDLTIPQTDITPENFRSVASVEALLERLLELKAPQ